MHPAAVPTPHTTWSARTYEDLLERVRYDGIYPDREQAGEVTSTVLAALGRQLTGDERVDLAARLPREAAQILAGQIPDREPLTGPAFVKRLAGQTGGTLATTRWNVGTVLGALAALAGPDLLDRILAALPPGYAILFGRAELTQARATIPAPARKTPAATS